MAHTPSPGSAARAAVNAAAILTRELDQRVLGRAVDAVASDGRKQRWARHKEQRRAELIEGTIDAVRTLGPDCGMDEIARHVGISKTVLYRYFSDRNDLTAAVTDAYLQGTLLPRLIEALTDDLDDYALVRGVIDVYVRSIAEEPSLYRYCMSTDHSDGRGRLADAQGIFAGAIGSTLQSRLTQRGAESAGARTWALTLVGGAELAVDRWLEEQHVEVDQLIDELAMLIWGGIAAVVNARGCPDVFNADPPTISPILREAPAGAADAPR